MRTAEAASPRWVRQVRRTVVVAAFMILGAPWPVSPQAAVAPPRLDYGPHGVGFRVIEALDSTRAFRPAVDWRGRRAAEMARPVQVGLWYPTPEGGGGIAAERLGAGMAAGEFRLLREAELSFEEPGPEESARLRRDFIETATGYGADPAGATRLWDGRTPAVRGAPAAPGPHPAVIYFTSAGVSNPLLPAYLASHGFVVATFPSNGRMTEVALEYTPNALTLDTDIDDAGFVHALLRRIDIADTDRLGIVAFSGGSLAALLWAMRDMQAGAVATLEGWERYRRGADIIRESVHYDPARLRVPFLLLERAADETSPQFAKVPDVVDSLRYADRLRVSFRDASHGDFLSHAIAGQTADQGRIYARSARLVRWHFEAHLQGDHAAADSLAALRVPADRSLVLERRPGLTPAPTEEELYRLAETDPAEAARVYRAAAAREPGARLFRERVLLRAALFASSPQDRVTLLELVVEAYPESEDARRRLAEAREAVRKATGGSS